MLPPSAPLLTRRHEGAQRLRHDDAVLRLVILQDGAHHACGGAHGGVQHVHVLGLRGTQRGGGVFREEEEEEGEGRRRVQRGGRGEEACSGRRRRSVQRERERKRDGGLLRERREGERQRV